MMNWLREHAANVFINGWENWFRSGTGPGKIPSPPNTKGNYWCHCVSR